MPKQVQHKSKIWSLKDLIIMYLIWFFLGLKQYADRQL